MKNLNNIKIERNIKYILFSALLFGILYFILGNFFTSGYFFKDIMLADHQDVGMDYYYHFIGTICGKNAFNERWIAPPLLCLLGLFIRTCMPLDIQKAYDDSNLRFTAGDIRTTSYMVIPFLILLTFSLITIAIILFYKKQGTFCEKYIFAFISIFSCGWLHVFDRGNFIFLGTVFALVFLSTYHSKNRILKEIGLIALGVSAGIKLYTCVYGILLLAKKDFKAAIRAIIYGIAFVFLPFLYYGSINKFTTIFNLLGKASPGYGDMNTSSLLLSLFKIMDFNNLEILTILIGLSKVLFFISLIAVFSIKKEWKQVALSTIIILSFAGNVEKYMLVLLILPLLFFIDDKNKNKLDYFYMVLFILLTWIFPFTDFTNYFNRFGDHELNITTFIQQICVFLFLIFLSMEGLWGIILKIKNRNNPKHFLNKKALGT